MSARSSGGEVALSLARCVMKSAPVLAANAMYATCTAAGRRANTA